jgi:release factor glutamine methyltransferase
VRLAELLGEGRRALDSGGAGALEAEVLLAHALGRDRAWLYANPEAELTERQGREFRTLVDRRSKGEPVAYLTGTREFWSLPLKVTPDVLIPRPETELLVEAALEFVPADAGWRIADLGTGSGAVAIALARERPGCEVHATEYDPAAFEVARENIGRLAPGRVRLHQGPWLGPLDGRFHLIVSNPPYVGSGDPHLQQGDCRFEPADALTPGPDAMAAIRLIAEGARSCLEPGGMLAFEHGYDQGGASLRLLRELGYEEPRCRKDLEGRDRISSGRMPA